MAQIFQQHLDTGSDITLVCTPNYCGTSGNCEYVTLDQNGQVNDLAIHPSTRRGAWSPLEVYIMSKDRLLEIVEYCTTPQHLQLQPGRAPAPTSTS